MFSTLLVANIWRRSDLGRGGGAASWMPGTMAGVCSAGGLQPLQPAGTPKNMHPEIFPAPPHCNCDHPSSSPYSLSAPPARPEPPRSLVSFAFSFVTPPNPALPKPPQCPLHRTPQILSHCTP